MPILEKEFKIGLLVTALLEDKYNQTGHMRGEANRVASLYEEKLKPFGKVVNPGFFENEPEAAKAAAMMKNEDVDIVVFIEIAYQKGIVAMRALLDLDVPIVIWNSQLIEEFGEDADFDLIMVNSGMAGLPEVSSCLIRSKKQFYIVTGSINDESALKELSEYITAAKAVGRLKNTKIGIIGPPYEGMTDLMQDNYALMDIFGCSCWPVDHDEVTEAFLKIDDKAAKRLIEQETRSGKTIDVEENMMIRSAKLALAVEEIVNRHSLDAVALFDQIWMFNEEVGIIPSYATSRMLENHVPFACEADVLRAIAMLVLEEVAGHSTFLEHYILDYKNDVMFNAHENHGNMALADPEYGARIMASIYSEGTHGFGAACCFSHKPGDITLFSIGNIGECKVQFVCSQGQALKMKPRDISSPQTFFKWQGGGIKEFSQKWLMAAPSHHHVAAYGKLNSTLNKVANMVGAACQIV